MQYLSSGPNGDNNNNYGLVREPYPPVDLGRPVFPIERPVAEGADGSFQFGQLVRRYWMLLAGLAVLGAIAGFTSVVLSSPMYRSILVLELQNPNGGLLRGGEGGGGFETSEVDIQTQVSILQSAEYRQKAAAQMQVDSVPLPTAGRDFFSRIRSKIHPSNENPSEAQKTGLAVAVETFIARPVNHTRLIELVCQSTSPDVAAGYLDAMSAVFISEAKESHSRTSQSTNVWVASQIEDTKQKVLEAEQKLNDYDQASGNVFAGQDATLDNTKLAQLKSELAKIQQVRINRQARYEATLKNPPEHLAEVLDDNVLRGYQVQIENLKREKAALLSVYTEKHEKVRRVDAQLQQLQRTYDTEMNSILKRIKNDYESAQREESLLSRDYKNQSQRVGSEASKAANYASLRREAETQRQMYQSLLLQQSQANMSGSVPVTPIRVVQHAQAPERPYKPRAILNISFGVMFGLALCVGIIFVRERLDRSIKAPGASRRLFNAPELGVIPNLGVNGFAVNKRGWLGAKGMNGTHENGSALVVQPNGPQYVTESFRSTLASILRAQASGKPQKIILVTSPGPSEGKTTVVHNLGMVLAETGRRVLLVDADFRRPHLHRKFGLPNEWGLIDVLCDDLPLDEYPPERLETPTGLPGLSILPNRVTQNNVAKALYSPRLRAVLEMLSRRYDMILVDAPPILSVADARIIAPLADSVILVLRCGVTDRESAMEAHQRIQEDGVSVLGTVLTDYNLSADRRRQYYYDYGDTIRA